MLNRTKEEGLADAKRFRGRISGGIEVLVTIYPKQGDEPEEGEIAFRRGGQSWGVPHAITKVEGEVE